MGYQNRNNFTGLQVDEILERASKSIIYNTGSELSHGGLLFSAYESGSSAANAATTNSGLSSLGFARIYNDSSNKATLVSAVFNGASIFSFSANSHGSVSNSSFYTWITANGGTCVGSGIIFNFTSGSITNTITGVITSQIGTTLYVNFIFNNQHNLLVLDYAGSNIFWATLSEEGNYVTISGTQTISGQKTFSNLTYFTNKATFGDGLNVGDCVEFLFDATNDELSIINNDGDIIIGTGLTKHIKFNNTDEITELFNDFVWFDGNDEDNYKASLSLPTLTGDIEITLPNKTGQLVVTTDLLTKANLDENGKILASEIPDFLLGQLLYSGNGTGLNGAKLIATPSAGFNAKTGTSFASIKLSNQEGSDYSTGDFGWKATEGMYFIMSVACTFAGITFQIGDWLISTGTGWSKISNTDAVTSVAGRIGDVILTHSDITDWDAQLNLKADKDSVAKISDTISSYSIPVFYGTDGTLISSNLIYNEGSLELGADKNVLIGIHTGNDNNLLLVAGAVANEHGTLFLRSYGGSGSYISLNNDNITMHPANGNNDGKVVPSITERHDLGSSDLKWKDIYLSGSITNGMQSITIADLTSLDTLKAALNTIGELLGFSCTGFTYSSGRYVPVIVESSDNTIFRVAK